jgi:hypothetical protein
MICICLQCEEWREKTYPVPCYRTNPKTGFTYPTCVCEDSYCPRDCEIAMEHLVEKLFNGA